MNWQAQGVRAWLLQHLSALYLALFAVAVLVWLVAGGAHTYQEWRALLARPAVNVAVALAFAALLMHAWVGVRDVLIDYVHPAALRFGLLALLALALLATALWAFMVLLSVVVL